MEALAFTLLAAIAGGVWGICRVLDKIHSELKNIRVLAEQTAQNR